jgi:serine/threonine-protein kinase RsbW
VYLCEVDEFHFKLPVDASFLGALRRALSTWLESVGVTDHDRDNLVLATHEAAADAIEHGGSSEAVWVDAFFLGGEITVEVHDNREWKKNRMISEERRTSLNLVEKLVPDVEILEDARGTTFRLLGSSDA